MARDQDIERRLINWADWLAGLRSRGLGFASANMAVERVDGEGYDAPSRNPVIDDEAEITDQAVKALVHDLQRTVVMVYAGSGGMEDIATKLGVSKVTVHARIWQAHHKIKVWLSDRSHEARLQQERDDAMRRSMRPRG